MFILMFMFKSMFMIMFKLKKFKIQLFISLTNTYAIGSYEDCTLNKSCRLSMKLHTL
jgi:hypothetical protein